MNMKKFRIVCKITSILLKIFSIVSVSFIITGLYLIFFSKSTLYFSIDSYNNIFVFGKEIATQAEKNLAALFLSPVISIIFAYVLWKGSILFDRLTGDETPFSFDFSQSVRHISIIIMAMELLTPLLHSLILTIVMNNGYYFSFGISTMFFIGLILYAVSKIQNYGIELQQFSDNSV